MVSRRRGEAGKQSTYDVNLGKGHVGVGVVELDGVGLGCRGVAGLEHHCGRVSVWLEG